MGGTIATALSTTLRPAAAIHRAMQTSTLHSMPLKNATSAGSAALAATTRKTCWPSSAAVERAGAGQVDEQRQARRADEVAGADDDPVAQDLGGADAPAGPGHGEQVVAGEELGAGDHHQQQAEREHHAAEDRLTANGSAGSEATSSAIVAPRPMKAPASSASSASPAAAGAPWRRRWHRCAAPPRSARRRRSRTGRSW